MSNIETNDMNEKRWQTFFSVACSLSIILILIQLVCQVFKKFIYFWAGFSRILLTNRCKKKFEIEGGATYLTKKRTHFIKFTIRKFQVFKCRLLEMYFRHNPINILSGSILDRINWYDFCFEKCLTSNSKYKH